MKGNLYRAWMLRLQAFLAAPERTKRQAKVSRFA
jgi:hypothetical protein